MRDSNYYRKQYKEKKEAINGYDKNIRELQRILNNLTDNLYDEIGAVNCELDDLKEDLNKGVRHNSRFSARANAFESKKEKAAGADRALGAAIIALQEEISRVSNQKTQAVAQRDAYYQQYESKKQEEREAFWGNLT